MDWSRKTVFVLGAGFTRAFISSAPLLIDKYGLDTLLSELGEKQMERGKQLLRSELDAFGDGTVNIERLMTRLEVGMPYDGHQRSENDFQWLLHKVKQLFLTKIKECMPSDDLQFPELRRFAGVCVKNQFDCITFNYDDLLDRALFEVNSTFVSDAPHWNPDRGYGFPCPPSDEVLNVGQRPLRGPPSMYLVKLHGSLNWRVRYGQPHPYMPDSLVHHEQWTPWSHPSWIQAANDLLEQEPVFVPPILTKNALQYHPVLRLLWSDAYERLAEANQVVFLGYSMPLTDLGSGFLFRESLRHLDPARDITVVGYTPTPQEEKIRRASLASGYHVVFGDEMPDERFDLTGAKPWIQSAMQNAECYP